MTCGQLPVWIRRLVITTSVLVAFVTAFAGEAQATCFSTPKGPSLSKTTQFAARAAAAAADDQDASDASIVGMWNSEFLLGDGPDLFDQSFQQYHSDGTEMMLSRGLPPVLGNVCVGVWKQTGARTFKLRHMAWNWDSDGHFISIFVMEVTIRLDRRGQRYSGTWRSDNLSPTTGAPIPGEHFEGIVRGTRITVD
jgi:hypothetical protein